MSHALTLLLDKPLWLRIRYWHKAGKLAVTKGIRQ